MPAFVSVLEGMDGGVGLEAFGTDGLCHCTGEVRHATGEVYHASPGGGPPSAQSGEEQGAVTALHFAKAGKGVLEGDFFVIARINSSHHGFDKAHGCFGAKAASGKSRGAFITMGWGGGKGFGKDAEFATET